MKKRRNFVSTLGIISTSIVILSLIVLSLIFHQDVFIAAIVTIVFVVVLLLIYYSLEQMRSEANKDIEDRLQAVYKDALEHGDMGILVYDSDYEITFLSDFFLQRHQEHLGEKLLNWLPELQSMLNNETDLQTVIINDEKFLVHKVERENTLIFKNITEEYDLNRKLNDDSLVLGMLSYDNYDEASMSEDDLSYINSNIKVPVVDYFKSFNVVCKTLRNNSLLLLLDEKIFKALRSDRFAILGKIRKVAKEANIDVTLSIAFARGSEHYEELDETVQNALNLAQTRGGDQVVVRKIGEDALFYGGTSEAREKRSKTKVRVMAGSIKDLIEKSSNVIIAGHKEMDADCIGSAIGMSNIVMSMNKPVYIVSKSGGVEPMINDVLNHYESILEKKHHFISEQDAMELLNDDTLVVMVDHHVVSQSNCSNLLKQADRVIIVDHHRRKADLEILPLMIYVEAAASSACEIVAEMFPYFGRKVELLPEEANILYLGILIDTDRFRVRTGSRTFDVAKQLRSYGADPMLCDEMSQEPYRNVLERSKIINSGYLYRSNILIASLKEGIFSRSIASQACDMMIKVKDIEAAFVICKSDKEENIISARSKGKINVQVILEKMNGGGHMTAAGVQSADLSVEQLEDELLKKLDEYFEGGNNESNTVE